MEPFPLFITPHPLISHVFVSPQKAITRKPNRFRSLPLIASVGPPSVLSIDIGTSATKAGLYCPSSRKLLNISHHSHETLFEENTVMQRPSNWLSATIASCREVLQEASNVVAVSITGQMQDLIAVGDAPFLLQDKAMLYSDARCVHEAAELSKATGTRILPTDLLPKLSLLSIPTGQDYKLMIGAADFISYVFSGQPNHHFTDATTAATTGLTKHPHRSYDLVLFRQTGLSPFLPLLPSIMPRLSCVGNLDHRIAAQLGRPELAGIPVIHAGGDAYSATVGASCDTTDSGCYVYGGSSGWVGSSIIGKHSGLTALGLAHADDDGATILAASVAAVGTCVAHACNTFLQCEVNEFNILAGKNEIGARGVLYVPYISGRRCPPASAVGSLHGLTTASCRSDIARAVVEGVVFALAEASIGMDCQKVKVVGGMTGSKTFVEGIAALFNGVTLGERDVGVLGAGIVGGRELGIEPKVNDKDELIFVTEDDRKMWTAAYERWRLVVSNVEVLW